MWMFCSVLLEFLNFQSKDEPVTSHDADTGNSA